VDELRAAKPTTKRAPEWAPAAVRLRGFPFHYYRGREDFETAFARLDPLRQVGLVIVDYLQLVPPPKARTTQTRTPRWCCGT